MHPAFIWFLTLSLCVYPDKNTDELHAKTFLDEYNTTAEVVWNDYTEASWKYNTDINEANKQAMVRPSDWLHSDNLSIVQALPLSIEFKGLMWF